MKIKTLLLTAKDIVLIRLFNKSIPLFVSWQITERCNLRCKYCDYWADTKNIELSTRDVLGIIDQLAQLGTRAISFTGGEPLLRNDIQQIIEYAKEAGIITKINSNGLLIPRKIDEIINVDRVNLSFDGPESIHDQVRGAGSYETLLKAVEILKKGKIKTTFHVVLSKYNLFAIDFILDKCRELNVGAFFQPATELFLFNKDVNPHSPDKEDYSKAIFLLYSKKKNRNKYIYNSLSGLKHLSYWPTPRRIYCSAGKLMFRINSSGEFYHCERFPKTGKFNYRSNGITNALQEILPVSCKECWCGPLVELNLAMDLKFDAILNAFKL